MKLTDLHRVVQHVVNEFSDPNPLAYAADRAKSTKPFQLPAQLDWEICGTGSKTAPDEMKLVAEFTLGDDWPGRIEIYVATHQQRCRGNLFFQMGYPRRLHQHHSLENILDLPLADLPPAPHITPA